MRVLLIDDVRNLAADRIARTYEEGIKALQEEKWDVLLLDHDLSLEHYSNDYLNEKTGYDVLCWLEKNTQYLPGRIQLVTANPAGRKRMEMVIRNLYGE